ncbi:MAG: TetR/AcrR family transcriptional regulator [Burkholderiaceae bacterium]
MRSSRARAEDNRQRVVDESSRLFRERGFDGVGIADLMQAAGMTHGGFYKQFQSKDDLAARASEAALARALEFWHDYLGEKDDPRAAFVRAYLSPRHRDAHDRGCLLPALAADAARRPAPVRQAFTDAIVAIAELLERPPAHPGEDTRGPALAALAQVVGAVVLARATDDAALSGAVLDAARRALGVEAAAPRAAAPGADAAVAYPPEAPN